MRYKSVKERFEESWIPEPYSGCWLWTGALRGGVYGQIMENGKRMAAHRVSWKLRHGYLDPAADICHHCDTPMCVNPDHLFSGNARLNVHDAIRKGRKTFPRGYGMVWETVREIKGTHYLVCKHGHQISGKNLYISPKGRPECKECRYNAGVRWRTKMTIDGMAITASK